MSVRECQFIIRINEYISFSLARRSLVGMEYLPEIHQKYGDYLYK